MRTKYFRTIGAASLLLAVLVGCAPEQDSVSALIAQSPFRSDDPAAADNVLILSCLVYDFELPANFQANQGDFWIRYGGWGIAASDPTYLGEMQKQKQEYLTCWQNNGFRLAIAPQSSWSDFRQSLIDAGAAMSSYRQGLFRRPSDTMNLPTYEMDAPQSVFVREPDGQLRGYRLEQGAWFFRIHLTPQRIKDTYTLYFQITPGFLPEKTAARLQFDRPASRPEPSLDPSEILFDAMAIRAMLEKDWFVVVAGQPSDGRLDCLGGQFLWHRQAAASHQKILVIVPDLQTGAELRQAEEQRQHIETR